YFNSKAVRPDCGQLSICSANKVLLHAALSKPRHRFAKCTYEKSNYNACDGRPTDVLESPQTRQIVRQGVQHRSSSTDRPEYFPLQRHEPRGVMGAPRPTLNLGFPPHAG